MRSLLRWWRMHRLRVADYEYELQLDAFDSGMNRDIEMLRRRYTQVEKAALAVKNTDKP